MGKPLYLLRKMELLVIKTNCVHIGAENYSVT